MSQNSQKGLFQEFSGENVPTRKYGGAGLGLAVTKSEIEKMGGKITNYIPKKAKEHCRFIGSL